MSEGAESGWRSVLTRRSAGSQPRAWLLMMIIQMPMAGAGLFGLNLGIGAPIATLILHIVFGAVLGAVYGWLRTGRATATQRA